MVKEIPPYVCDRCGYKLGKPSKEEIERHQGMSETGADDSLDGLILKSDVRGNSPYYIVFRRAPLLNTNHEVIYTWEKYDTKTYDEVGGWPEDLKEMFDELLREMSTARYVRDRVLKGGRLYKELTKKELRKVAKKLKSRYPKLYKNIEFKRTIEL